MMKKIAIIFMGILVIVTALTSGCIKEIEEEPSEVALYTYTAAETGADGYITKPFTSEDLLNTISKFVKNTE